jgi:2-polyprenyl-6-methoxyphenol hydroxylase-like FAD-dependent oxidoreductase
VTASIDAPVLIAGAGPVGLALAVGLAHHGVRSVVLEESAELSRHQSRAPGVLPRTLETFAVWGVLDRCLAEGTFLERPQAWTPGRDEPMVTVDFTRLARTTAAPGVLILPQNRTERILLDRARTSGLADVRFGRRVTGFEQDANGVTVDVERDGGRRDRLRGDYLVGCDGAHSTVREALGLSLEGKTYPARLLLADVGIGDARDALPWPRTTMWNHVALGALRLEAGLWRVIAAVERNASDEHATSAQHLGELVTTVLGPGPFDPVWSSVFRIHCRTSPRFRDGRVLLAGDAAHINSPAGGQGMNAGIQDAHNLAWKLGRVLAGAPAEPMLASYDAERRPAILTNVDRYTDLLTRSILLAPGAVRRSVLTLGRLALGTSALTGRFLTGRLLRRAGMLDTRYRASPVISGRGALLGARAPNARLARDGAPLRLHELAAREAALLLVDDGRLPRWSVAQVETVLGRIDGVHTVRLVLRGDNVEPGDLVDAHGDVRAEWAPRAGAAALLRPDGHIGWMAERPVPAELRRGVRQALGIDGE